MRKKIKNEIRLSNKNLLSTLNDLLIIINNSLNEDEYFKRVNTPGDLSILREKIKTFSEKKGPPQKTNENNVSIKKDDDVPNNIVQALSLIAINTWRIRKKIIIDSYNNDRNTETNRLNRHIIAIFDTLGQIGFEVYDPKGKIYDSGMALKVITFEPTPGLIKEEIIETIKPTIMWQKKIIQMGEIIVGTPQTVQS